MGDTVKFPQVVTVDRSGAFQLYGNRYWNERLFPLAGEQVFVRPGSPGKADVLQVYSDEGCFICNAAIVEGTGFADPDEVLRRARQRSAFSKAVRSAHHRTPDIPDYGQRLTSEDLTRLLGPLPVRSHGGKTIHGLSRKVHPRQTDTGAGRAQRLPAIPQPPAEGSCSATCRPNLIHRIFEGFRAALARIALRKAPQPETCASHEALGSGAGAASSSRAAYAGSPEFPWNAQKRTLPAPLCPGEGRSAAPQAGLPSQGDRR